MKLNAFDLKLSMTQAHDDAIGRARGNLKTGRQRFALDDQGMIAPAGERPFQSRKDRLAIVLNFRGFAVKDRWRTDYSAAEDLANRLVSEANAQDRYLAREPFNDSHRLPGALRRSGARRDHDPAGPEVQIDFLNSHLIVSAHFYLLAQLAEILHEVVSKRIVIVDNQKHLNGQWSVVSNKL